MKKILLFVFLLTTLSLGLVSAVDIEMKESVKKGENFIVKVSGKFYKPLIKDNIKFRRGNAQVEFGTIKVEKIENDKYFYLSIPETISAGNYTMTFLDSEYYSGTTVIKEDIVKNFEIVNEKVPFSISPPLIVSTDKYVVTIQNLMDTSIVIDLEKEEGVVSEGTEGVVIEEPGFFDLLFGTAQNETEEPSEPGEVTEVEKITLVSGEIIQLEYSSPTYKGFEKLNLYYNDEGYGVLVYNPEGREVAPEEEEEEKEVIIINQSTGEEIINDIELNEVEDNESVKIVNESEQVDDLGIETCVEMGGEECAWETEACTGEKVTAKNSICCIGTCNAFEESSSGKTIGWIIIGVIALFLTWFFKKKYRKASPGKVDLIKSSKPKK